jgi:methionyl-tRNA formyltransferase
LAGFREKAALLGVPLTTVAKNIELADVVRRLKPAGVLVVGWYRVIDDATLAMPRIGFAGVHASLLPRYRGHSPLVWALINGEHTTGVTLFRFGAGVDDGDVIDQARFAILPDDTIAETLAKATEGTATVIERSFLSFLDGTALYIGQDHAAASYGGLRRPEDGQIDWTWPAERVHDFVRAQSRPYPGAYSRTDTGALIRIWRTARFPHPFYGVPGVVGATTVDGPLVACGDGAVVMSDMGIEQGGNQTARIEWGTRLVSGPRPG